MTLVNKFIWVSTVQFCGTSSAHGIVCPPPKVKSSSVTICVIPLPYDPVTLSSGHLHRKFDNVYSKRYMHPCVHCSIIHSGQDMETTEVSFNRWLVREDVVPMYNGILLSHKNDEILHFQKHGWNLRNSCSVKEIRQQKVRTIWLHSYVGYKTESNKWTKKKSINS